MNISRCLRITLVFWGLSGFLFALSLSEAYATSCACKQHSASAEASGTCSRTEDEKKCTLSFTTTTPEEYETFRKQLGNLNLKIEPRAALQIVFEQPPVVWSSQTITDLLPVLFAISQRTHFETSNDFNKSVGEIRDVVQKNASDIARMITSRNYEKSSGKIRMGNLDAIISYGCIELNRGRFYAMVKTRWSAAIRFCDDFRK